MKKLLIPIIVIALIAWPVQAADLNQPFFKLLGGTLQPVLSTWNVLIPRNIQINGNATTTGNATTSGVQNATRYTGDGTDLTLDYVGSPTIRSIKDYFNLYSAGIKSGGTITDNGNQTVAVAAGEGTIATGPLSTDPLVFMSWPASSSIAIPSATEVFIGVDYNGGSPIVIARTSDTYTYQDNFPIGRVIRDNGTLHISQNGRVIADAPGQLIRRFHQTLPYARDELVGGLIIGETGTRNVTLSTGYLWDRSNRFYIPATRPVAVLL